MNPTIVWGVDSDGNICNGGTNITTKSVVVGQQIAFTACFPEANKSGVTITSEAWTSTSSSGAVKTVPWGTVVSGYNASTTKGCVVKFGNYTSGDCTAPASSGATCGTANYCDFPTFYWVDTGGNGSTFTIKYTYTLSGTTYTGSASLTFDVQGVTGAGISPPIVSTVNVATNYAPSYYPGPYLLELGDGSPNGTPGIQYSVSSTTSPPSNNAGTYSWVQLIVKYVSSYLTTTGRVNYESVSVVGDPSANPPIPPDPNPQLDSLYPYATGKSAEDSPAIPLQPFTPIGEGGATFSAITYLMWTPNADSSCASGSSCVVPVPLGSFTWGWSGDAINTLAQQANGTTYYRNCPTTKPTPGNFQVSNPAKDPNYSYPVWQHTASPESVPE